MQLKHDFQTLISGAIGLCFTLQSDHNMKPSHEGHLKIRLKKDKADIFVHDQQHFFMNTNPGFTKMNTWMTVSDNQTFQMQRMTLVKHRDLDTASKPCHENTSFSLARYTWICTIDKSQTAITTRSQKNIRDMKLFPSTLSNSLWMLFSAPSHKEYRIS